MFNRKLSLVLAILLLLTSVVSLPVVNAEGKTASATPGVIFVDGQKVDFSGEQPIIGEGGSVLAPILPIGEMAYWNYEETGGTAKVTGSLGITVEVTPGNRYIKVNGVDKPLSAAPILIGDQLMIPVEDLARAMNCHVERDIITNDIYITTPAVKIYSDRWAVVPEVGSAPEINGVLDEASWSNAAELKDFVTVYYGEPANPQTKARLLYDMDALYIGIETDEPENLKKGVFQGVEIFLKTDPKSDEYFYIQMIESNVLEGDKRKFYSREELIGATRVPHTDYTVVKKEENGVWTAELKIPYSGLGISSVEPGEEWSMNIVSHRALVKPMNSWIPIRSAFFWDRIGEEYTVTSDILAEGSLGRIFFKEPSGGAEEWRPSDVRLEYVNYNKAALSFHKQDFPLNSENMRLTWIDPSGREEVLVNPGVKELADRQIVVFEYPGIEKWGIYQLCISVAAGEKEKSTRLLFDRESIIVAGDTAMSVYTGYSKEGRRSVEFAQPSAEAQRIIDLIPDKTGFIFCGLPSNPNLYPSPIGHYDWSASSPNVITGKADKKVYPNDEYPADKKLVVKNNKGDDVEYPYYEDDNGYRYFFEAHIDYKKLTYVLSQVKTIAANNPMDGAWVLYELYKKYEGYIPTHDAERRSYLVEPDAGPPFSYWGGLWNRWFWSDLASFAGVADAFAEVRKTDAFDKLSAEMGVDVERTVTKKMIEPTVDHVLTYFQSSLKTSNMIFQMWNGLIPIAKALGEPKYIHLVSEMAKLFTESSFLSDGFFFEVTGSYHQPAIDGFVNAAKGMDVWKDPAGYISPRTGKNMQGYQPEQVFPNIDNVLEANNILAYPDKKRLPSMDTWAGQSTPVLKDVGSILFPATRIGRLASGTGADQTQLYMMFQPKYGHTHYDFLNMNLYSLGQELLPDLGYTNTKYRKFTISTLGHNTVTVNAKNGTTDGKEGRHGGNIEIFAKPVEDVQVMRANYPTAYPETEEYRREPWLIGFDGDEGSYVVDIFRVKGGERHEYSLQADANHDSDIETEMDLEDYGKYLLPGDAIVHEAQDMTQYDTAVDPKTGKEYYGGYVRVQQVKSAAVEDGRYSLDIKTKDDQGNPLAGMKITGFTEEGNNTLFTGKSPAIRSTRTQGYAYDKNDLADQTAQSMSKYVLRREGENLRSTFTTVIEPYNQTEGSRIERIEQLEIGQGKEGSTAVKVSYGNTVDIILSSTDPESLLVSGDISMMGSMGFIRMVDGKIKEMYLIGGSLLKKGETLLTGQGTVEGTVKKVLRQKYGDEVSAFMTDTAVSRELEGKYIVVTHPDGTTEGYEISGIERVGEETFIKTEGFEPGFVINGDGSSEMKSHPFKRWTGETTFRIENTAEFISGSPRFFDSDGNELKSLPDSGYIKSSIDINNMLEKEVSVKLIAVLKNEGESVVRVQSVEKMVAAGATETLSAEFLLPENNKVEYLDVYVWNTLEGMRPITKNVRIQKQPVTGE